jgi:hypothetical protein
MDRTEMINYLTKEIETLSKNTMDARSKISFSLLIGPFIVLGSIIVSTPRTGLNLSLHSYGALIAAFVAVSAFWTLGGIAGHIEEGAWQQCNRWRKCIIKLQHDETLTEADLEELILEKALERKVKNAYLVVFLLILITFGASTFLAAELVRASPVDNSKAPAMVSPSSSP